MKTFSHVWFTPTPGHSRVDVWFDADFVRFGPSFGRPEQGRRRSGDDPQQKSGAIRFAAIRCTQNQGFQHPLRGRWAHARMARLDFGPRLNYNVTDNALR